MGLHRRNRRGKCYWVKRLLVKRMMMEQLLLEWLLVEGLLAKPSLLEQPQVKPSILKLPTSQHEKPLPRASRLQVARSRYAAARRPARRRTDAWSCQWPAGCHRNSNKGGSPRGYIPYSSSLDPPNIGRTQSTQCDCNIGRQAPQLCFAIVLVESFICFCEKSS